MRLRILDTATQMFIEEGFENTSLRKIAKRIEYSPAAIYLYFKDKAELVYGIHERGFGLFLEKLSKSDRLSDPLERLIKMGELYMEFALQYPAYYDLMFLHREPINDDESDEDWHSGRQSFAKLHELVGECIESGQINLPDADVGSLYIWSFMHGMTTLKICERLKVFPNERQHKKLMEAAMQTMIRNATVPVTNAGPARRSKTGATKKKASAQKKSTSASRRPASARSPRKSRG